ncbi:putative P-loop containing nucleoside triphosphate hydrolase [Medicago truncatula]|uniref:Putative P-loop containing nucleoside triphosphate hydrolase n=1 Tax=Medicago truncatula TaxID=3880 RepID=A0A396ITC3_MEDTR|nr:putative disease resistance protein At5g05400 [Medicago truncatula]RHN67205.1 putative P-loop containing nucleoside triphosphate hydrolase [Medicago truncatula]
MAENVISIVAKLAECLAECLVKPVIREGKYFLCVNKVIRDLENEREDLISERDNLLCRVKQAKERTEIIEKPVEKWLDEVKSLLEEVEALKQRMRTNTRCFQRDFPTWRRYRLSKQMVKKAQAMERLKGKSNIQPFSHLAPLPGIQYQYSSENFTCFQSTKVAYNQLLELLRDDCIHMIGVYGMGGCGKTTLATEVGKKAEESNMFDKVILITVSQTPNVRKIQGKMAALLNLKLSEEDEDERAQRLWLSLKEKKTNSCHSRRFVEKV